MRCARSMKKVPPLRFREHVVETEGSDSKSSVSAMTSTSCVSYSHQRRVELRMAMKLVKLEQRQLKPEKRISSSRGGRTGSYRSGQQRKLRRDSDDVV